MKEELQARVPPTKLLLMMYSGRLGLILSNFAILAVVFSLSGIFSVICIAVLVVLALLLLLVTLGGILIVAPDFFDSISNTQEALGGVIRVINTAAPYLAIVTIVCAALSIVFLMLDKSKRRMGRIIFNAILSVVGIVVMILAFMGGLI